MQNIYHCNILDEWNKNLVGFDIFIAVWIHFKISKFEKYGFMNMEIVCMFGLKFVQEKNNWMCM